MLVERHCVRSAAVRHAKAVQHAFHDLKGISEMTARRFRARWRLFVEEQKVHLCLPDTAPTPRRLRACCCPDAPGIIAPGRRCISVWQQQRSDAEQVGDFATRRDVSAIFRTVPSNVFLVKATYWMGS